ncbi:MAG: hypothetical protein ABI068_18090 [Ktedonobacterales bacterium]
MQSNPANTANANNALYRLTTAPRPHELPTPGEQGASDRQAITAATPISTPATMRSQAPTPARTLLTAASVLRTRPQLAAALRVHYAMQIVRAWEDLLNAIEQVQPDLVLVDMDRLVTVRDDSADVADHTSVADVADSVRPCPFSGLRLVKLLARQLGEQATQRPQANALIVLTALDYAELEELAPDIHAIIAPDMPPLRVIAQMDATLTRRAHSHSATEVHTNTRLH